MGNSKKRRKQRQAGRIPKQEKPKGASGFVPQPAQSASNRVVWCFKYFDDNHKVFSIGEKPNDLAKRLLGRLKQYGSWTLNEFTRAVAVHSHKVDPEKVHRHGGFTTVSYESLWMERPWQVQIENKMRIIGFLVRDVFCVVWIDLEHKFDPGNQR